MKILLDENFPLQLYRALTDAGYQAEHIIVSGRRGMSDAEIIERLASDEDLVFLTQDLEFESLRIIRGGKVIVSRVRQQLPIERRVEIWFEAVRAFLGSPPDEMIFELRESGEVVPATR